MQIQIIEKQVYGNTLFYPACDQAKKMAQLTGTKTLTDHHLQIIRKMGYSIKVNGGMERVLEAL